MLNLKHMFWWQINQSINDKQGNITSLPINTATLKLYIRTFVHSLRTHIRVPHTDKRLSIAYLNVDLPQDDYWNRIDASPCWGI